jgi:nucleotide-binding universal stress UspA family protein
MMSDQTIVVALDGSELSERALPHAAVYAKALGARLLLVTIWEGAEETLGQVLPGVAKDLFAEGERYFERYLAGAAKKVQAPDLKVDAEVLTGHPADEIVRIAGERKARLLVLASHGRSGLGRWMHGSVAGDLVRRSPAPTLVVGPKVLEQAATEIKHGSILVPLDGSELAEEALAPAQELAQKFGAEIVLAQVLGWAGQAFMFDVPGNTVAQIDNELTKASEEYLAKTAARLGKSCRLKTAAMHGMPAEALIDLVARDAIDLVVMTSHGRGGLSRAALGSVADRMLQASAPVLLVRPPDGPA